MRLETEIRAEMNHLTGQHKYALANARQSTDEAIKRIHLENALLLRGKILGLTWVLRNVGRQKVYKKNATS